MKNSRRVRELRHSRKLAALDTEHVWGWNTPAGRLRAQRRARLIAERACLGAGTFALEIGCGTGFFTKFFAQTGARITAIDISPQLLSIAGTRLAKFNNVELIRTSFEDCSLKGPYDAIIGSSILHHLDIHIALRKAQRLLRPGGIACFAEPNLLNPHVFLIKKIPWLKRLAMESPDETAFQRWILQGLLVKSEFEQIEILPFDWVHPWTPRSLIPMVTRLGIGLEKITLIREFAGSLLITCRRPKNGLQDKNSSQKLFLS